MPMNSLHTITFAVRRAPAMSAASVLWATRPAVGSAAVAVASASDWAHAASDGALEVSHDPVDEST